MKDPRNKSDAEWTVLLTDWSGVADSVIDSGAVTVLAGCAIATVDDAGTEHTSGYVVIADGRIAAVGAGDVPATYAQARQIDGAGLLVTPGLVNTHHHLYQWITRGYAVDVFFSFLEAFLQSFTRSKGSPTQT